MIAAIAVLPLVALLAMAVRRAKEGNTPEPRAVWPTTVTVTFQEIRR